VSTEIAPIETGAGTTSTSDAFRGVSVDTNDMYTSYVYGREAVGTIGLGVKYSTGVKKMYEGKEQAIQIIHKQVGSSGVGDMFDEIGSIAWKSWMAAKILDGRWLVKVLTLSKKLV